MVVMGFLERGDLQEETAEMVEMVREARLDRWVHVG